MSDHVKIYWWVTNEKKKCHSVTNLTYGKKDWSCIFDWNSNDRSLSVHHHITINKVIEIYANEIFFFCCLLFWITIKSWKLNESTMSLREWVSEKKQSKITNWICSSQKKKEKLVSKTDENEKKVDRKKNFVVVVVVVVAEAKAYNYWIIKWLLIGQANIIILYMRILP